MSIVDLQKTAEELSDFPHPVEGNFKLQDFKQYYDFRILQPSDDLAPFVAYYSVFEPKLPDGFELKFTQVLQVPAGSLMFSHKASKVFGVTTKRIDHRATAGDAKIRVVFKPGGLHAFRTTSSMSELVGRSLPVTDIFPEAGEAFTEKLLACDNDENIALLLEKMLSAKNPKFDANIALISSIVEALDTDDTLVTVGAVAKKFNRSERWLQQLFYTYVGVGLKWVMMRTRIIKVLRYADGSHEIPWSQIAADLGYSTQSHLINDFKSLVGRTPTELISKRDQLLS